MLAQRCPSIGVLSLSVVVDTGTQISILFTRKTIAVPEYPIDYIFIWLLDRVIVRCWIVVSLTSGNAMRYSIKIFCHLMLCLATATHNFKWMKISRYLFNFRLNICKFWCLNTNFVLNNKWIDRLTEYIRFQANFRPINSTRIAEKFCIGCSVNLIITFWRCNFFIKITIFRHLELEIALAIPASNEWKIIWRNRQDTG